MEKVFIVLVCGIATFIGIIALLAHIPQKDFDDVKWKSFNGKCAEEKYAMIRDLSTKLKGLTRSQVLILLGAPTNADDGKYEYCAGPDFKFSLDRPTHLIIEFQGENFDLEQRVKSVEWEGPK